LCVANIKIEVSFLKLSDFSSPSKAFSFSVSLVIDKLKLSLERSGWVTMWFGYSTSKI